MILSHKIIVLLVFLTFPLLYNNCAPNKSGGTDLSSQQVPLPEGEPDQEDSIDLEVPLVSTVTPSVPLAEKTELVWLDEFDRPEDYWTDHNEDQGPPGFQYTAQTWYPIPTTQVLYRDGLMVLNSQNCPSAPAGTSNCGAEVNTAPGMNTFTHGHLEIRTKFPGNVDRFSGFWMQGKLGPGVDQWPRNGEIQLVLFAALNPNIGDDQPYGGLRWFGTNCPDNTCQRDIIPVANNVDYRFAPHTWSITRSTDLIEVLVDGQLFWRVTRAELAVTGGDFNVIFNSPMHIRARNQSGLDASLPIKDQQMEFDYMRIWKFVP